MQRRPCHRNPVSVLGLGDFPRAPERGGLEEWGAQLQASGDLTAAEDRYQRALAVRLALLDRGGSSKTLRQLADICHTTGRGERAATLSGWAESVANGTTIDWSRLRGDTLPR